MTPEQKAPTPPPADNSAPLGEAISIVPGSFDDESAKPQVVGSKATTQPQAITPTAPSIRETKEANIAARAEAAEPVTKDRTITPPVSVKPTPITELINPSEWFKEDAPRPTVKKTWYGKLMSRLQSHPRMFTAGVLLSICLIWGGVFAYIAAQHGLEKAGQETTMSPEELNKANNHTAGGADTTTGDTSQPTADTPADQPADTPGSNDTGNLAVSGDDGAPAGGGGSQPQPAVRQPSVFVVTYTSSCFTPSSITIQNGDIVTFKNNSNKNMWPASDPHPSHSAYPEFDPGQDIAPGSTWSFTFNKSGSWGYHDHNKPSCHGTVTVS